MFVIPASNIMTKQLQNIKWSRTKQNSF